MTVITLLLRISSLLLFIYSVIVVVVVVAVAVAVVVVVVLVKVILAAAGGVVRAAVAVVVALVYGSPALPAFQGSSEEPLENQKESVSLDEFCEAAGSGRITSRAIPGCSWIQ